MADRTRPSGATRDEEAREARAQAGAPQVPTAEEEKAADSNELDPSVSEHEKDMTERGANQKGEGRLP
ncbi:MAG TPA: hypothetical protein VFC33_18075 [Acidimicrobiia bacterium]|nr:hypothetical protein [Acidimicrobiia bacterium]